MTPIIDQVKAYLAAAQAGEAEISEETIEWFGNQCKEILRGQFEPKEKKEWGIRMSAIGKPLCQQQMEKAGVESQGGDPFLTMRFLFGDMIEAASIAIMKGAGIGIQEFQQGTSYTFKDGGEIDGTLDVIIDDKVYDIKSASPFAFKHKFASSKGFSALADDDPFGYVSQGYLYSEGVGKPFGGWIVVDKSSGHWTVLETPLIDSGWRKKAITDAEANYTALKDDAPFQRCFDPVEETFNKKATGNYYLDTTCSYCSFKHECYKDTTLEYLPQPKSKAANPRRFWYVGSVT